MDDLISIFTKSIKEMGKSPILVIMGFILGVLAMPAIFGSGQFSDMVQTASAYYIMLLFPLLLLPFFTGGALGYALEIRNKGSSSWSTFIASAVKNYPRMFIAGFIVFIVFFASVTMIALSSLLGDTLIISLLITITALLAFFILMAIEFYDIGIVADGLGIIAAFRNSIDFVRRNLVAVLPFFIVLLICKAIIQMQIPLSFGVAGTAMGNSTYYTTFSNANASMNFTAVQEMLVAVKLSLPTLLTVAAVQAIIQSFVFAFLALFKTEFYLTMKNRKKITDFDYEFSDDQPSKL